MFSFRAYFCGSDVYINEHNKYAANEILTAYLNADIKDERYKDWLRDLKKYRRKLQLSPETDYEDFENYNRIVYTAAKLLQEINDFIMSLPPYGKTVHEPVYRLEDLLNNHSILFDDSIIGAARRGISYDTFIGSGMDKRHDSDSGRPHLTLFIPHEDVLLDKWDEDYDPVKGEKLAKFNADIAAFFDGYLTFLQSLTAVRTVFAPFVADYLNSNNGFPQNNDLAKLYDRFSREHGNGFDNIHCSLQSYGYKLLLDEHNAPILCNEIRFGDLQSFLFYDFFNGIKYNYIPNRCKNCGRYFLIRAGKYFSYCSRPLEDEPGKTCRDVGARKRYDDKCKTDPVWQIYNRAYKAHYARYMKKKMTVSEFEEWSRMASELRDKAITDEIPFEQYCVEIKK